MHCDTFKTIQMWLFTFTNSKVFLKKKNNKQTKRWTGHGLIVIRGKVKTIKLRERNDKTRKTAAALADILNTRDTVSVIWRRRQQISEDDFQANPQELWSWVRRLNFPRVCQKRGQKRRCKNFLVFPVKKKNLSNCGAEMEGSKCFFGLHQSAVIFGVGTKYFHDRIKRSRNIITWS